MQKSNVTQDAAVRLMLKFPFWSELYYTMTVFEDTTCKTLSTDGRNLWVNPTFWASLSLDIKVAAVAHEIGHKMLLHTTRRGSRHPELWNIAADYVVNAILKENGFTLGQGWLFDPKYARMSTEEVYHLLEQECKQQQGAGGAGKGSGNGQTSPQRDCSPQQSQDGEEQDNEQDGETEGESSDQQSENGAEGDGSDGQQSDQGTSEGNSGGQGHGNSVTVPGVPQSWHDNWKDIRELEGTKEEKETAEKEFIEQVQKAVLSSKACGKGPAGMEAFDDVCQPSREPWYNHLHRFMQALSVSEYNWARFNRRTLVQHQMFAPHIFSESLGDVVIAIDCSGSVFNSAAQANFAGHVNAIMAEAKPAKVHILYFDSRVTKHDELDPGALEFKTKPSGGGGTSFEPIFVFIEEKGLAPEVAIILTDCFGSYPDEPPPYPTMWASICDETEVGGYYPPFGEFVYVDPDA